MMKKNERIFPPAIAEKTNGKTYHTDGVGRSESEVLLFDDMVLKIEKTGELADNEEKMMSWLCGKLPVPRVLGFAKSDGKNYLLTERLRGHMAFDAALSDKRAVARILAKGLLAFWAVDAADCPVMHTLEEKLAAAKARVDAGELTHLPDGSVSCLGFSTLEGLYAYLDENRPAEDLVLSHGDYCLPNVLIAEGAFCGFLDLGRAGVSDRWSDIADCLWSMHYNFCELGGMSEDAFEECKTAFFSTLGVEKEEEKIKYYDLLNEFFA